MTGFAAVAFNAGGRRFSAEVRSVNGRFLHCVVKLPEETRPLEPDIRRALAEHAKRGRVEFSARVAREDDDGGGAINEATLAAVAEMQKLVHRHFKLEDARPLSVAEIIHLAKNAGDSAPLSAVDSAFTAAFLEGAKQALAAFDAARTGEGERLRGEIADIFAAMAEHCAGLDAAAADAAQADRDALIARLADLQTELPPERLAQEAALLAAKSDIREEIARLKIHLDEMRRLLAEGGAVGRRLDVLLQECQREANTLAAKTGSAPIVAIAVELRLLAEQAREQAQNLE